MKLATLLCAALICASSAQAELRRSVMPRGDAPGTEPNSSLQLIQACPQGFPHYCTTQGGQNYCCSIPARHMCLSTMTCFGALTDEQLREEAARCPIWIDCG